MEKLNLDQEYVEHVDQAYRQAHCDANDLAESYKEGKVTASTLAAVGFLGFTFQSSLTFTVLFVFPVIAPIALGLSGSTANLNWLASGWSLSGSIALAIAGQLSDYLGRRWLILTGQMMLLVGHVIAHQTLISTSTGNEACFGLLLCSTPGFPTNMDVLPFHWRM